MAENDRSAAPNAAPPGASSAARWLDANAARLFMCGFAVLFWELVLIRWLGANVRVVAYFSNLVLISAFFGLGTGALMTRFPWRLERAIAPLIALATLLALWLGGFQHANPSRGDEYIWSGTPFGLLLSSDVVRIASASAVLTAVYCVSALVFVAFGQYMGRLFRTHPPLRAYSLEVAGSLAGIALFALLSHWQASPTVWMVLGFGLLLALLSSRPADAALCALLGVAVTVASRPAAVEHIWSPYYRISVHPITRVIEHTPRRVVDFASPVGYALTVNNDYHQMMLDLGPRADDHPFLAGWRSFYDAPYRGDDKLPPGPVLVVGAGTGNDVSAALRNTDRAVTAVEIDPAISTLGLRLHAERPYQDPRVTLVTDDARSFFHHTDERYALVVFGFLDSHRLLSTFSSVRLDNFVYTAESMAEVRQLLRPGGRVALSFASNRSWIHARIVKLLDDAFDYRTSVWRDESGYANGLLYVNGVRRAGEAAAAETATPIRAMVPTDDWPFLYLRRRAIPGHNLIFLLVAIVLSASALRLLPAGERRLRLPYLFLGAAFFLLETSNVVRMSLLYGSTWWVNTVVFAGILILVLLSNLTAAYWRVPLGACLAPLGGLILLAAVVPAGALLALAPLPRAVVSVAILLGPVYFGGLIFARLISSETRLFEAYGSNVLGAVIGGGAEYLSLVVGFRFLLAVALVFYLVVYLLLRRDGTQL